MTSEEKPEGARHGDVIDTTSGRGEWSGGPHRRDDITACPAGCGGISFV
jgi:hypothetical protein